MDLSGLKWPLIIAAVVLVGWLASSGGVNWMYGNFTKAAPGEDFQRDATDEQGLTKLGGYLLILWRYEKAAGVMETAMNRYPDGANYWYNYYRLAKCYDRMKMYQDSYNVLMDLIHANASEIDSRVANNDSLRMRAEKLKEVHELP